MGKTKHFIIFIISVAPDSLVGRNHHPKDIASNIYLAYQFLALILQAKYGLLHDM